MSRKRERPLEIVAPAAASAPATALSPSKRLRRAGLVMMWLKPKPIGEEQMAVLIRQMQVQMVKLFMLLMFLVTRLANVERLLLEQPYVLRRLLEEHFGIFQRPNISEGFPQTGGSTRMVKLFFVDVERPEDPLFTGSPVHWQDGPNAKVAILENGSRITQGDLSKLQIEILPVHDDFFTDRGAANFTKEEFNKQIYMCKGKESVLKTVNLTNGVANLGSFFFTESSHGKRLRLAARVKYQDLAVRVQEATSYSFVVKDRRSKLNKKSNSPSKEEGIHCLKKISPKGKRCNDLAGKDITKVKHLMRCYHRDPAGLQKLTGMKNEDWNTMISHATTSDPGDEIHSYRVEENTLIFFNDFFALVGMSVDGSYAPYHTNNLNQLQQRKMNKWKESAYKKFEELEKLGCLIPDHVMINGLPVSVSPKNDASPSIQATPTCFNHQTALEGQGHQFQQQNGISSVHVSPYNVAETSTQLKEPLQQYPYEQKSGGEDPSMQHNETSYSLTEENILNGLGSGLVQSATLSQNTAVVPGADPRHSGNASTSTAAAVGTSCPVTDAVGPWNYPINNLPIFSELYPILMFFQEPSELSYGHMTEADQAFLPDSHELANADNQFTGGK
uniref:Calmodulin-binding protein-like n=1 Tax=Oryza punctata TaxID=4537 RepID=A0A0E0KJN8_ORYPU